MDKKALRDALISARQGLGVDERERLGHLAQKALVASPWFAQARRILLYLPIRGEVDTREITRKALAEGKGLALPRVVRVPKGLALHAWSGSSEELEPGAYGILEPRADLAQVELGQIDLVVVPGVGFDRKGNRLGYGGGYYDRTLPLIRQANPQATLLGLAYSLQVVEALPVGPHDIALDGVVTDAGIVRG